MTEIKQINIFGNETEPVPETIKGRPKYPSMQTIHGLREGKTCKTCEHLVVNYYNCKRYYKCELWITSHSAATDIRLKNTACGKYEEEK